MTKEAVVANDNGDADRIREEAAAEAERVRLETLRQVEADEALVQQIERAGE